MWMRHDRPENERCGQQFVMSNAQLMPRSPPEYACRLAERGVPITKIQYLLGHASVVTTERYIHHTLAELSKAAAVLEGGGVFDPHAGPKVGRPVSASSPSTATPMLRGSIESDKRRDVGQTIVNTKEGGNQAASRLEHRSGREAPTLFC
jgi:hypothetical protein